MIHVPLRYLKVLKIGKERGVERAIMPVIGNRADLDVCQSVLVVQQPRLDRGGTHGVCVAV